MSRPKKGPARPVVSETTTGEGQGGGTAQNSDKQRGRPFTKDDPRINRGGRPGGYAEFREMCRSKSPAAVQALEGALTEGGPSAVAAARVLLEYGWGKPSSAPEDLDAVREGGGSVLSVLTRDELLAIARLPDTD